MAVQIQTRRSSTQNDRPFPTRLGEGELALNITARVQVYFLQIM